MIVFFDSNVLLYALLPNQEVAKVNTARTLYTDRTLDSFISTQVINEVTNNLLRKGRFSEKDIRSTIQRLYQKFRIIQLSEELQVKASKLRERYQFSHFDGLIVAAALESGASVLYSEDMHDGLVVENSLTIRNPFLVS